MKLFIWEGDGVLTDYTDGMICALGKDLADALEAIREACDYCMNSFPNDRPTEIVDLPHVRGVTRKAWVCYGGG